MKNGYVERTREPLSWRRWAALTGAIGAALTATLVLAGEAAEMIAPPEQAEYMSFEPPLALGQVVCGPLNFGVDLARAFDK